LQSRPGFNLLAGGDQFCKLMTLLRDYTPPAALSKGEPNGPNGEYAKESASKDQAPNKSLSVREVLWFAQPQVVPLFAVI